MNSPKDEFKKWMSIAEGKFEKDTVKESPHSQDALALNPDLAAIAQRPGLIQRVGNTIGKVARNTFLGKSDEELLTDLEGETGGLRPSYRADTPHRSVKKESVAEGINKEASFKYYIDNPEYNPNDPNSSEDLTLLVTYQIHDEERATMTHPGAEAECEIIDVVNPETGEDYSDKVDMARVEEECWDDHDAQIYSMYESNTGNFEEGNEFANQVRRLKNQGAKVGTKFKTSDGEEHTLTELDTTDECYDDTDTQHQTSDINVSNSYDNHGNKNVNVSANGSAADDLLKVLQMAGIDKNIEDIKFDEDMLKKNDHEDCGCGSWDCEKCFPDQDHHDHSHACSSCGHDLNSHMHEVACSMEEELENQEGEESPLTYGEYNLSETPENEEIADGEDADAGEKTTIIDQITYMQDIGLSGAKDHYSEQQLRTMPTEKLEQIHRDVFGNMSGTVSSQDNATPEQSVAEATGPKPTKTRSYSHLDDLDDILNPKSDYPIAGIDDEPDFEPEDEHNEPARLPAASPEETRRKTQNLNPSELMRDFINRINPDAGAGEPDIPDTTENEIVVRTARDVPTVISTAMQAAGVQNPEWHTVRNLPGFMQRNIRGMGRQVFGMMTRTPLENIQTIANVEGQGPNTDAEMRAVAGWLRNNAEDLGRVEVGHGMAIPGYEPEVREYRARGVRFHVVRDPMGQYIYAYPDSDARINNDNRSRIGNDEQGEQNMPRLQESLTDFLKPTLFERIMWDEEINEILKKMELEESQELDESSLSRLIGKQPGGQALVKWLHRKHKLSNEAELEPVSFNKTLLWTQFKKNPDDFVIVSGQNGVAGIKPSEKHIERMTALKAKKGETYNPARDSTLPYQIIAFKDSGEQVNPELLRPRPEAGEEPEERDVDPTVIKARMGVNIGKDIQNTNNTFALLNDQIGPITTVWITGFTGYRGDTEVEEPSGSVEREKMAKRAELKKTTKLDNSAAIQKIFQRVRPVLKTLGNQAVLQINRRMQRYIEGGNFDGAQKLAASGSKLKQFLAALDTVRDITIDTGWGSPTRGLSTAISSAVSAASGSRPGSDEYDDFLQRAAMGGAIELKPVLDALRDKLVGLD